VGQVPVTRVARTLGIRIAQTFLAMKLRVQREDGQIETLELCGTWVFQEGKLLGRMVQESGCEYFFTPEGYYDGRGSHLPPSGLRRDARVITANGTKRGLG
jgi:hypothetical protein